MSTDIVTRSSSKDFSESKAPLGDSDVVPISEEDLYIDPVREAQLVRKLDMRIAPVVRISVCLQ
jgi:hypothetical protein